MAQRTDKRGVAGLLKADSAGVGFSYRVRLISLPHDWPFQPLPTVQLFPVGFGSVPSPLLEKKGHAAGHRTIPNTPDPIWIHLPVSRSRFSTRNHPRDTFEIQVVQGSDQRFARQEPYLSVDPP